MKVNEPKYITVELNKEEKNILDKAENIFVDLLAIMEDRKLNTINITSFEWDYNDLDNLQELLHFLAGPINTIKVKR